MALALLGRQPPTLPENGHSKNGDSENGHKAEENGKTETENGDADKETTKRKAEQDKPEFIATEGESKHESHDEKYDKDRETANDRVHEALEQVYNDPALNPGTSGIKRKAEENKPESILVSAEKIAKLTETSFEVEGTFRHFNIFFSMNNENFVNFSEFASSQMYRALYDYKPMQPDELALKKDELYFVIAKGADGWFKGSSLNSLETGVFPGNYVLHVQDEKNRKEEPQKSCDLIDFTSDVMDVFGANNFEQSQGIIFFQVFL